MTDGKRKMFLVVLALGVIVGAGCGESQSPADPEESVETLASYAGRAVLDVYTVNYPLAYFAQRIGGDRVDVTFPAPEGEDPAMWSPDIETVTRYQQADLVLLNGAGYAKWVDRVSLPASILVDTSSGLEDRLLPLENAVTHSHGPEGAHEHVGYAFTTWLDFEFAIAQAHAVAEAFGEASPADAATFDLGLEQLESELHSLDTRLSEAAASLGARPLFFSHPVYQYLIDRYGLHARSVHWEPGEMPSEQDWLSFQQGLGEHPAKWMIWEAQPVPEVASRLEEMGVGSAVFDPAGGQSTGGDFVSRMQSNIAGLEAIAATHPGGDGSTSP